MFVIVLHLALYLVLRNSPGWQVRPQTQTSAPRTEVTLRLLPWRDPATVPAAPPRPARAERTAPSRAPRAITAAAPPAAGPLPTESAQAMTAPAPWPAASQPPRPLELRLPPGFATRQGARNPAVDDPRANSARLTTPEQRMGATFDTRLVEEDLGEGRRRIRQGANCVVVRQSRIGQLMPFNESAVRTPALVGACP